jgi:hypothetical protein
VEAGVREGQARRIKDDVPVEQQININQARAKANRWFAPQLGFEQFQRLYSFQWEQGRGCPASHVEEFGLGGHVHRLGFVYRRDGLDSESRGQGGQRPPQVCGPVAKICAEGKIYSDHESATTDFTDYTDYDSKICEIGKANLP